MIDHLQNLSRADLCGMLEDAAKLWLAHDGLWFQAVEKAHGMDSAIERDREAWQRFTVIEARRIMKRHGIEPGGGLDALEKALRYRLYAWVNVQEIIREDQRVVFRMRDCRVQSARRRKGLPDFPCKSVGLVEYAGFAATIDPRIRTRCICCPPDAHPDDTWCAWEFTLETSP